MSTVMTDRPRRTGFARYRQTLWLLTSRDLKVRYSTSALGYVWSILDPLVMAGIYFFVFHGRVPPRPSAKSRTSSSCSAGSSPWMWFNGAVSDSTRAFLREAKLVRSTKIPRTIWVNRLVASKGIEFLFSLPVLALFAVVMQAHLHWQVVFFPLAIVCRPCS